MLRNAQPARLRTISCLSDCELHCHPHDSGRRATGILRNHASQELPISAELKMPYRFAARIRWMTFPQGRREAGKRKRELNSPRPQP